MSVKRISEILIYPIKSLGGISVPSARVQPKGLQWDRRWMLVDEQNNFLTQRVWPRMALFTLQWQSGQLIVRFRDEHITIPMHQPEGNGFAATVWNDTVEVIEVSPTLSAWFSKHLEMPCKLVFFPENNPRAVDAAYKVGDDHVSLADAYPMLIIGQESLNDLNKRLSNPVPMNRFRPNLVFTGGLPYEEDGWQNFSVGAVKVAGVKPCARCVLTTVDQATGEKGTEPLATLSTYRKVGAKVLFGQNLIALNYSEIFVGDEIRLTD